MENIVRTIRVYYPVSDEALATLAHGFEKQVFPVKTLIIRAGQFDRQVHFIEKGMTRSYTLHDGKEVAKQMAALSRFLQRLLTPVWDSNAFVWLYKEKHPTTIQTYSSQC